MNYKNQPRHNPYGPDWPDANYHPDWPHTLRHGWNDTEPAAVVPCWDNDCCEPSADDCVCVTEEDVELWNTISAVSGLTAIDIRGLSGLSALEDLDSIIPAAELVEAYSGVWMSAENIPDIYDDLSAMSAKIDTKAPLSAEYLQRVYSDPYFFDGAGTKKSVLQPSQDLKDTVELVYASSDGFTKKLVNTDECELVEKNIKALDERTNNHDWQIQDLYSKITPVTGSNTYWQEKQVTIKESKQKPDVFYYFSTNS